MPPSATPVPQPPSRARLAAIARRVERSSGELTTRAQQLMRETLPWFPDLAAEPRSMLGLMVQTGISGLATWLRDETTGVEVTGQVFAVAPGELAQVIRLEQTVELVRVAVQVAEEAVGELAPAEAQAWLRDAVLRYSREIAFAAALVYARAAEQRGAWDARLEALVVDAVSRGEGTDVWLSRAAALGWARHDRIVVLAGPAPEGDPERLLAAARRTARDAGADVLVGVQAGRLVLVVQLTSQLAADLTPLLPAFGPGPVVAGPEAAGLPEVSDSAAEAFAGLRAVTGWPGAPRPVASTLLLPERALGGEAVALAALAAAVWSPLAADPPLLATADAYLAAGGSIEATARALFVHANTVRYRLRRITDVCGLDATRSRDRFVLQVGLAAGRLPGPDHRPRPALDL